jgi:hypothetical protein
MTIMAQGFIITMMDAQQRDDAFHFADRRSRRIRFFLFGDGAGRGPCACADRDVDGEPGGEIQAPMAMVILFGLLSSTTLKMIVVPVLYERFGSRGPVARGSVISLTV